MTAAATAEVVELTKTCTKCKIEKPIVSFSVARREADGRTDWCRDCQRAQRLAHQAAHPTARSARHARAVARFDPQVAAERQIGTRICCDCKQSKPFADFPRFTGSAIGVGARCKPCNSAAAKAWREANRHRDRANGKANYIRRKYGLNIDAFEALMATQGHRCAICRAEFRTTMNTCVDHCHKTGELRGLLCRACNIGLGGFKDDVEIMAAATIYIKRSRGEY